MLVKGEGSHLLLLMSAIFIHVDWRGLETGVHLDIEYFAKGLGVFE
jgi:hypothetical protein